MSKFGKGLLKRQKSAGGSFAKDYVLSGTVLGKGAYATVKLGQSVSDKRTVAVKIIDKKKLKDNDLRKLFKEVRILQALKHRHVVKVYNYYDEPETFYIVMEYIKGGELFKKIVHEEVRFSEEKSREIVRTLAEALKHCKDRGIIHRDIKPENILLTTAEEGEEIKVVDFNLAKDIDPNTVEYSTLETMCGTPNYVAPEVVSGSPYGYKCDIWSIGVITFLLLSGGYLPFFVNTKAGEGRQELLAKIREGRWKFAPAKAWENVSPVAKEFLLKILRPDPEARYNYEQLLAHAWFDADKDSLNKKIDMANMITFNERRKMLVAAKVKEAGDTFADLMKETNASFVGKLALQESSGAGFDYSTANI